MPIPVLVRSACPPGASKQRQSRSDVLQRTYQLERLQVRSKWPGAGTADVCSLFRVHRERAKGHATQTNAYQDLQGVEGTEHSKEVVEVPERNIKDEEASYSCECREEEREARMKREVL